MEGMSIKQALGKRVRQFLIVVGSSLVGIILALWLAIVIIKPGPAGRIVLATGGGGGAYQQLAETWKRELSRFGVTLELRPNLQGLDVLQALAADDDRIDGGVLKGGLAGSLQGRMPETRTTSAQAKSAALAALMFSSINRTGHCAGI